MTVEATVGQVNDLKDGEMKEVKVGDYKALLSRVNGQYYATGHLCTHYKAPLVKGTLSKDGRIMCPWHGATYCAKTGDIEDAPGLDSLNHYSVTIQGQDIIVKAEEHLIKEKWRAPEFATKKNEDKTIVVVGGGAGGLAAVDGLRQAKFEGKIVLISAEPYLPIDRPKLSKSLTNDVDKILLRDAKHFEQWGISVHLSRSVKKLDSSRKTVTLDNGEEVKYDGLVLAPGGAPRTLPIKGQELDRIYVLRSAQDAQAIDTAVANFPTESQPNVTIIGSSFIGMEAAAVLAKKCKVTVIGMETVPFERVLGPQIGAVLGKMHEEKGVRLVMKALSEEILPNPTNPTVVGSVRLNTGEIIPSDIVVLGVGVKPATEFLTTDPAIKLNKDGSVNVDKHMKVEGLDNVYAVGDIARYHDRYCDQTIRVEHWSVAQNQGKCAGWNLAGKENVYDKVAYFWTMQYGKSVRYCGHAENFDDIIVHGDLNKPEFVAYYARGDKILAVASLGKDPIVSKCSELIRINKMPSAQEIKSGKVDIFSMEIPC